MVTTRRNMSACWVACRALGMSADATKSQPHQKRNLCCPKFKLNHDLHEPPICTDTPSMHHIPAEYDSLSFVKYSLATESVCAL